MSVGCWLVVGSCWSVFASIGSWFSVLFLLLLAFCCLFFVVVVALMVVVVVVVVAFVVVVRPCCLLVVSVASCHWLLPDLSLCSVGSGRDRVLGTNRFWGIP